MRNCLKYIKSKILLNKYISLATQHGILKSYLKHKGYTIFNSKCSLNINALHISSDDHNDLI